MIARILLCLFVASLVTAMNIDHLNDYGPYDEDEQGDGIDGYYQQGQDNGYQRDAKPFNPAELTRPWPRPQDYAQLQNYQQQAYQQQPQQRAYQQQPEQQAYQQQPQQRAYQQQPEQQAYQQQQYGQNNQNQQNGDQRGTHGWPPQVQKLYQGAKDFAEGEIGQQVYKGVQKQIAEGFKQQGGEMVRQLMAGAAGNA